MSDRHRGIDGCEDERNSGDRPSAGRNDSGGCIGGDLYADKRRKEADLLVMVAIAGLALTLALGVLFQIW